MLPARRTTNTGRGERTESYGTHLRAEDVPHICLQLECRVHVRESARVGGGRVLGVWRHHGFQALRKWRLFFTGAQSWSSSSSSFVFIPQRWAEGAEIRSGNRDNWRRSGLFKSHHHLRSWVSDRPDSRFVILLQSRKAEALILSRNRVWGDTGVWILKKSCIRLLTLPSMNVQVPWKRDQKQWVISLLLSRMDA